MSLTLSVFLALGKRLRNVCRENKEKATETELEAFEKFALKLVVILVVITQRLGRKRY